MLSALRYLYCSLRRNGFSLTWPEANEKNGFIPDKKARVKAVCPWGVNTVGSALQKINVLSLEKADCLPVQLCVVLLCTLHDIHQLPVSHCGDEP